MKTGLVSVTFRKLSVEEIIKLAYENGLEYIEWGSQPHVPMGDVKLARRVKSLMHARGLKCSSYGSYYGVTYKKGQHRPLPFKKVCKTALALGTNIVRIWAGWPGCGDIDEATEARGVLHTREIADVAKKYGITIAFECHWGTITEDYNRAIAFIKKVCRDNVKIYWQPNPRMTIDYDNEAILALKPYVVNAHVCNHRFINDEFTKKPLSEGYDEWLHYARVLSDNDSIAYLLEFMPDGEPTSLPEESKTLLKLANEVK